MGMGRVSSVGRIQFGPMFRASEGGTEDGSSLDGFNEPNLGLRRDGGPSPQSSFESVVANGGGGLGPMGRRKGPKGKEKVLEEELGPRFGPFLDQRKCSGPSSSCLQEFGVQPGGPSVKKRKGPAVNQPKIGPMEALAQLGLFGEANFELEFLRAQEKETENDQKANPLYALVDNALEDEAWRYEAFSTFRGFMGLGEFFSFFFAFAWLDSRGGVL